VKKMVCLKESAVYSPEILCQRLEDCDILHDCSLPCDLMTLRYFKNKQINKQTNTPQEFPPHKLSTKLFIFLI